MRTKSKKLNYTPLFKKSLTNFFMNLVKFPDMINHIVDVKKNFEKLEVSASSALLISELENQEKHIMSDNKESLDIVFSLSLFNGKLPLEKIKEREIGIKHLRLIYLYAKGVQSESEAQRLLTTYGIHFKKNNLRKMTNEIENSKASKMSEPGIDIKNFSKMLPPNLGTLFSDISEDIDLESIDLSNPMSILTNSMSSMHNVLPKIQNKIGDLDTNELGMEIAQVLKSFSNKEKIN